MNRFGLFVPFDDYGIPVPGLPSSNFADPIVFREGIPTDISTVFQEIVDAPGYYEFYFVIPDSDAGISYAVGFSDTQSGDWFLVQNFRDSPSTLQPDVMQILTSIQEAVMGLSTLNIEVAAEAEILVDVVELDEIEIDVVPSEEITITIADPCEQETLP